MKVVMNYPPNIEEIKKAVTVNRYTVFTYGDTLYAPFSSQISDHLMVHEETHMKQQTNPEEWWARYLKDVRFRAEQELEAYHNQYEYFKSRVPDFMKRMAFLMRLAEDLASPMYGSIMSFEEAKKAIESGKLPTKDKTE